MLHCSAEENPDVFAAARVSVGALGVITSVTLQCVPAFLLRAQEMPLPLAEVLDGFDELADGNDHFEFYWFPHTDIALTKRNNRVAAGVGRVPGRPDPRLGRRRAAVQQGLRADQPAGGPTARSGAADQPASRPAALSAREYVDASYKVFCAERNVVFRESEYAVPREHVVEVIRPPARLDRRARARASRSRSRSGSPLPDDIWLSTAYGRDTAYIAIHQYHRLPARRVLRAFERIVSAYDGRPHWGKLHTLGCRRPPRRATPASTTSWPSATGWTPTAPSPTRTPVRSSVNLALSQPGRCERASLRT